MKLSSLFLAGSLVAALAFAVPAVKADGVPPGDPIVKAAGAGFDAPAGIITTSFTISSPTGTSPLDPSDPNSSACVLTQGPFVDNSPACQFQNDVTNSGNGIDINALIFEIPNFLPSAPVNCSTSIDGDSPLFTGCTVASDGGTGSIITFTGDVPYGTIFTLGFVGFTGGVTTSVYANVPEPGVLMLLAIGFIALFGFGVKRSSVRA
jgi:hypothetical protein